MIFRIRGFLYLLLVFCIPFQVGYHFWPKFAFVNGVRIDYLSPTIFLTDILVLFLFIFLMFDSKALKAAIKKTKVPFSYKFIFFAFGLVLLFLFFTAFSSQSHAFGIVKYLEFVFLGWYTAIFFKKTNIHFFVDTLAWSSILASVLAVWQFILQSSVGGLWYFIGERTFTKYTPGIATATVNNSDILRSYGAFPHPNVLAFFLFVVLVFMFGRVYREKGKEQIFLFIASLVSFAALLFTFSRLLIILFAVFLIIELIAFKKQSVIFLLATVMFVLAVFYLFFFGDRFFMLISNDFIYRKELLLIAFSIFEKYPFTGVGFNNFYIYEVFFQKDFSPILLQPVHNIYALWAVQTGVFGVLLLVKFLFDTAKRLVGKIKDKNKNEHYLYRLLLILLFSILVSGFFDHYLITLQQGSLITALVLGLCWARLRA